MLDGRVGRPIEVLLVEDNAGDARLAIEALKDGKVQNNLSHVWDGVQALAFLRHEGEFHDAPTADIILLDLNLPRKDGREVLAEVKADSRLKQIPVVILTTSDAERDILKSYQLNANCFITKPVGFDDFIRVVRSIEDFWLAVVKLPPSSKARAA